MTGKDHPKLTLGCWGWGLNPYSAGSSVQERNGTRTSFSRGEERDGAQILQMRV